MAIWFILTLRPTEVKFTGQGHGPEFNVNEVNVAKEVSFIVSNAADTEVGWLVGV